MKIFNARVFLNGEFVPGGIEFDEKIKDIGPTAGMADVTEDAHDAQGCYIIPGLIDIHTHGAMGADTSDGDPEGMLTLSRFYAAGGVTSFCATTMTLKEPELTRSMQTVHDFIRPANGAKIAGVHLEGPFVCYAKRGAQAAENLADPDIDMFFRLNEVSGGQVRLITLAPELPGAMDFIREAAKYCKVSIGHTEADYDTAMQAFEAGASHATHLYNAMPPLLHRDPGVIGAAFDSGADVELITDGFHVHPAVIRITFKLFGEKVDLISDSLRCTGMPDGDYTLGGQPITMKNGKATLKDTDTLAGSSIHLMEGLRRSVKFGIPLETAVTAATLSPAKAIGKEDEIGSLNVGKAADLVILDPDLSVRAVYIDGQKIN